MEILKLFLTQMPESNAEQLRFWVPTKYLPENQGRLRKIFIEFFGHWTLGRKVKNNPNFIQIFSPYRAVNTLRLGYKNQSVSAVQGNNRCLF